ncbi:hypothetical protein F0562_018277 [Nyssa sinensis]|uniref:Prefoldin subunit 6 n=1 Tax=Nyssa sinensis TaxID=561372 RepID=A0A5J4ZB70_9ASTE|nr:hypothetical protein F0562_018277 [Nyssa sinensis]
MTSSMPYGTTVRTGEDSQRYLQALERQGRLLKENANVYKLIGPILVKQDLAEAEAKANANVCKRIDYISIEL